MQTERTEHSELPPRLAELTQLGRKALGHMTAEQSMRGELAIAQSFAPRRVVRSVWQLPVAAFLLGGAALACALLFRPHQKAAALSYVVEQVASGPGGGLGMNDDSSARTVRFSDGTEVQVDQGAQARIRLVTDHGAELALARGSLHAAVIHSSTSEWRFDAGPFVVHVIGTAFGLSWDPEQDRFDLRLEHGSVTVSSPVVNDPIAVRAGQWLTIRPHSNEVFIRDLAGPPREALQHEAEPASDAEREPDAPPVASSDPARKAKAAAPPAHEWAQDLLRGKADQIVNDALLRGLDSCLSDSTPSELAALADAARYTRRDDVARRVLLAERRRFPGSRTGADAALLLGRLAAAQQNDSQAASWFDTYLAEAPGGAHASEALGRKMAIARHSAGSTAARGIARDYLEKYPDGTYSSAARAILKSP